MLDKAFYEEEVKRLCLSFEQQVCSFEQSLVLIFKIFPLQKPHKKSPPEICSRKTFQSVCFLIDTLFF